MRYKLITGSRSGSTPVPPVGEEINVGALTRNGYGGGVFEYVGGQYLGITEYDGNPWGGSPKIQLDPWDRVVPKLGTSAQALGTSPNLYSAAPPTMTGPYTVVVSEYSDAGRTTLTGLTFEADVNIIPNVAHVIAVNSTATGIDIDSGSSPYSQLRNTLGANTSAGGLPRGATVIGRDSHFNPLGATWFIGPGTWTGSGRVTITSENIGSGIDENGYTIRGGGFKLGKAYLGNFNNTSAPLDFRNVSFYVKDHVAAVELVRAQSTPQGVGFYECDFRRDYTSSVDCSGANLNTATSATFVDCHFENLTTAAITCGNALYAHGNMFYHMVADGIVVNGNNHDIQWNGLCEFLPIPEVTHGDACQVGNPAANITDWGIFAYNWASRGPVLTVIESGQFVLGGDSDTTGPGSGDGLVFTIADMNFHHNMTALDSQAIIALSSIIDSTFECQTLLSDPCSVWTIVAAQITMGISAVSGWQNCTVTDNVTNSINEDWAVGCTVADNHLFPINNGTINTPGPRAAYLAALTVAFPNMWQTAADAPTNHRDLALAYTPADLLATSGGLKRADGTFPGALFPAVAPNLWGAWNDKSVFEPENPAWVAAHPPSFT